MSNPTKAIELAKKTGSKSELIMAISVVVGIGVALYGLIGYSSRCRKCRSWFSIEDKDKRLISEQSRSRDSDREEPYPGETDDKPGLIRRRERIFLVERKYGVTKVCSKCGESWVETEIETV